MKFNNLIKAAPILSTLLIIIFISISNQKENTKLRILIWNTPSLSLGNYLAISAGTGFILSYIITTNIGKADQTIPKESLRYRDEEFYEESNKFTEKNINSSYDNTLIERDIKAPSPTIDANFRIIGRSEKSNTNFINKNKNIQYENSNEIEDKYSFSNDKHGIITEIKTISSDWNDESYSSW